VRFGKYSFQTHGKEKMKLHVQFEVVPFEGTSIIIWEHRYNEAILPFNKRDFWSLLRNHFTSYGLSKISEIPYYSNPSLHLTEMEEKFCARAKNWEPEGST